VNGVKLPQVYANELLQWYVLRRNFSLENCKLLHGEKKQCEISCGMRGKTLADGLHVWECRKSNEYF